MQEVIRMTKDRRIFVMQCGFHAYMESWGLAVDNPYIAITQADGTFLLRDVPPGDYTLVAWHPGVGTMTEQKVTVPAKQMVKADFVFESPKGRRSAHEIEENPQKYWMVFKGDVSSVDYGPGSAQFIKAIEKEGFKPKLKNFVSIIEDTDFGRSVIEAVEKSMVGSDWNNSGREVVKIDQADYTAQMSKFKGMKPDIIFSVQTSAAAAASTTPAGVSRMLRLVRTNSSMPSCASISLIW
jgi:hypothetical protein